MKDHLLSAIPEQLRSPLVREFQSITTAFINRRWRESELQAGKFCEVTYSVLLGKLTGAWPAQPAKPEKFAVACKNLEQHPAANNPHSFRITIPRLLAGLYDIRNNRNVGHIGGDVDPSHMDAAVCVSTCQWVMAELVRVFHDLPTADAQRAVEALVERHVPSVWEVDGVRRVLRNDLKASDQALLLLHSVPTQITAAQLLAWVEYGTPSDFRRKVLRKLHEARLVNFNERTDEIVLSPTGVRYVEATLLPKIHC